jgi:CHAT domain-containing protein
MDRFYTALAAGATTDEALRAGQRELIAHPLELDTGEVVDASDPFYWAAFVLIGDWR